jgi:Fe-S-cluster-containing dehydrogenase component
MASCPYGARYVHPDGHVDKCTFCLHRTATRAQGEPDEAAPERAGGPGERSLAQRGEHSPAPISQTTACVEVCPTRSLTFGDRNDPGSEVSRLLASRRHEVVKPEAGTEPNVFFLV